MRITEQFIDCLVEGELWDHTKDIVKTGLTLALGAHVLGKWAKRRNDKEQKQKEQPEPKKRNKGDKK